MRRLLILLFLLVPDLAWSKVALHFEEEGVLQDAPYHIKVPENWNGTLLVYVRGTTRTTNLGNGCLKKDFSVVPVVSSW